jgi:hypothetical protein
VKFATAGVCADIKFPVFKPDYAPGFIEPADIDAYFSFYHAACINIVTGYYFVYVEFIGIKAGGGAIAKKAGFAMYEVGSSCFKNVDAGMNKMASDGIITVEEKEILSLSGPDARVSGGGRTTIGL